MIKIKHYKGYYEFQYESIYDWIYNKFLFFETRERLKRVAVSEFYERFSGSTKLHFDVIRALIEDDLKSDNALRKSFYVLDALQLVYGKNYFYRPDSVILLRRMSLVIDSLAEEGAVAKGNNDFRITPKAIIMLENYEMEKIKFETSLRESKKLNYLTAALIFVGLMQIDSVRTIFDNVIYFVFGWI